MKKLTVLAGTTFLLTFLVLFIYFYRSSGKFCRSIIAAFVALTVFFSSQKAAHSIGQADAFTLQNPQHQSRPPNTNQGFFGRNGRKSNNNSPGPGKPNDNGSDGYDGGIPYCTQPESVEDTQKRLEWIEEQVRKLSEETDSESEIEDNKMSSTLSKMSKNVRKDERTSKGLDKLKEQLKNGDLHAGRGAKKLPGSKTIFYMRSGGEARLFFIYSDEEKNAVEIIGESDKDSETRVIENLKKKLQIDK